VPSTMGCGTRCRICGKGCEDLHRVREFQEEEGDMFHWCGAHGWETRFPHTNASRK
jgi:hypothetical protein